ncbi:hypothetical protein [Afipia felis]|uniref:Uncharacterized protein n=2 Tax=Afipia felis TaxID=1035 RepID=A0A380W5K1_AFIFE|nr:hypothetical protein [Afipia felis]EKS26505.1 hypothetical protein HMPREF9697_04040 [Afipia felis ATCC 53690]SUU76161.1 Uncharacterised protein [Afipia felis]SUU84228.1 Uncharacterised protein [Afipia felis]
MSWLSSAVHSIFGGGGPSQAEINAINEQTKAVKDASATAKASADAALKAQQDANLLAQSSSVPAADSESARGAMDDELRKRLKASNGIGLPTQFGEPPVGYRMLAGQ